MDDAVQALSAGLKVRRNAESSITFSYLCGLPEGESKILEIDLTNRIEYIEEDIKYNISQARNNRNCAFEITKDSMELHEYYFQRQAAMYGLALSNVIKEHLAEYNRSQDNLAAYGIKHYLDILIDPYSNRDELIKALKDATRMVVALLAF